MKNLNEEIGGRISALRITHHITQEQLAEQMDVSVKHMSEVERGLSSFSLEKLIAVSKVFDCSLDYLILGNAADDSSAYLPAFLAEVYQSGDSREIGLLTQYLLMYKELRKPSGDGQKSTSRRKRQAT